MMKFCIVGDNSYLSDMNNPFDYTPGEECAEAFRELEARIEAFASGRGTHDAAFVSELNAGKMLGVLIAVDESGGRHTLYAFSGQVGDGGFHFPGFVGPVFDYLRPDGYFKKHEADISRQNAEIDGFEKGPLAEASAEYARVGAEASAEIAEYREKCRRAKLERQARRESGLADEAELASMIRQSQFEKAELRRLKKRIEERIAPIGGRLHEAKTRLSALKEKRRSDSESLQRWLFDNFKVLNARGESRSLSDIFAEMPMRVPPSGAGECCAPKLLQAAYLRGWRPEAIAEYWYGSPKRGEVRLHGRHYPACRGKCGPVLGWMLQGLEVAPPIGRERGCTDLPEPKVVFENEWFCVVDKPSGMLSVPGKGNAFSVEQWLAERYEERRQVKMVHRLDQDTSGLIMAAFRPESYKLLQSMFATRRIRKRYFAELDGDYEARGIPRKGRIELPLSPDWLDRPRQRVDFEDGKEAVTEYEFIEVKDGRSRVEFHPLTGRTHQLRVHAASAEGLGIPIVGDRLYGLGGDGNQGCLRLHASRIEFTFPIDGEHYCFDSPALFINS